MRRNRVKIEGRDAVYHVVNRVHGREFLFGEEEAEAFCRIMRRVAKFSGVEVITYCVLSNHFHLLVRVPKRKPLSDKELFSRYRDLAAASTFNQLHRQFELMEDAGNETGMANGRKISRDRSAKILFFRRFPTFGADSKDGVIRLLQQTHP